MQKLIIILVVISVVAAAILVTLNVSVETEYVPETEIEDTELRKTIISLFFLNPETKKLVKETRLIDSKELLRNPYEKVIQLLILGPNNSNNERLLSAETGIISVVLESGILKINLDNNLYNSVTDEDRKLVIESIAKTVSEFNEVSKIEITVDEETIKIDKENVENQKTAEMSKNEIVM